MKFISTLLLLFSLSFADSSFIKDHTKLSYDDFSKQISFDIAKELFGIKDFIENTGSTSDLFNSSLREALKDQSFKKSLYYFYFTKVEYNIQYGEKFNKNVIGSKLDEGFESLDNFIKRSNNPVAAYLGLSILMKTHMTLHSDPIAKKYTATFSKPLYDQKFCIGGLYLGKTFLGEYGTKDYSSAAAILNKTSAECINKDKIPSFYISFLNQYKAKANYLISEKK